MMSTDTPTVSRMPSHPSALTGSQTRDDDRRLVPIEDDQDVPRETLDILGQGRDALIQLISGVFQAAAAIVTALFRLVQSIAGRDVAEAVDRSVADVLDPLVPDLPGSGEAPPPPVPPPTLTDSPLPTSVTSTDTGTMSLRDEVRDVLLAHARSDEERAGVSPAFVEMVTTGVQFVLSVERQFPGAIDALQAQTAGLNTDRTEADVSPEPSPTPLADGADEPPPEAVVAY